MTKLFTERVHLERNHPRVRAENGEAENMGLSLHDVVNQLNTEYEVSKIWLNREWRRRQPRVLGLNSVN